MIGHEAMHRRGGYPGVFRRFVLSPAFAFGGRFAGIMLPSVVGLSRGAIQKAKAAGRLVLNADGSIDAAASDRLRTETTDPSKTRKPPEPKLKPVPETAVAAVGDTLREQGLAAPTVGGGTTFLQAKTANEVLKAQERRIRLQKLKGELVDRARAETLMFRLAREERDAWVTGQRGLPR